MTGHRATRGGQPAIALEIMAPAAVLEQATTLASILTVSLTAFQIIRQLARHCEDSAPELFAAFVTSARAATEGCESLMLAISSPLASHRADVTVPAGTGAEEIADSLAVLAAALTSRLVAGAAMATVPGDRAACQNAAAAARTVHDLLTGSGNDPGPR